MSEVTLYDLAEERMAREADKAALEACHEREAKQDRARVYAIVERYRRETRRALAELEAEGAFKFRVEGGYAPPWERHAITDTQHVVDAERFLATFEDIIVDETLMDYVADWVRGHD